MALNEFEQQTIKPEDYYKVFLIDGSDLQITYLENIFCECVDKTNYISQRYLRIWSCWERAFEYIYRAFAKNHGKNAVSDLTKASTEIDTICELFKKNKEAHDGNLNLFVEDMIPSNLKAEFNKVNNPTDLKLLHLKFDKYIKYYGTPKILIKIIDTKNRDDFLMKNNCCFYNQKFLQKINKNFLLFLYCNTYKDFIKYNIILKRFITLAHKKTQMILSQCDDNKITMNDFYC